MRAAEAARIQRKVDAKKAEAEAVTGAAIAREQAEALRIQRMEGYRAVFKEGKIPKGQIVYGDMAGMSMVGAFNLTYEAMAVIQAKVKNRTMTLNEAKAAYSWMKAREQLVTRHGRGSAGYEERIAKTQKVKEQLKQYGAYVKSGRIVPRIAPGLTPAVASSTMPAAGAGVGIDSMGAIEALRDAKTWGEVAEVYRVREAAIDQIRRARPEMTETEVQTLRESYDHSCHLTDLRRRVLRDTGSEGLAVLAVAGAQVNREVLHPLGEAMAPVMEVVHHVPVVGTAVELVGEGMHALEGKVSDGLTSVTGSRAFGDAVAPGLTQAALLVVPKAPKAVRVTGRALTAGVETSLDLLRRIEIGMDRTVVGSGSLGSLTVGVRPVTAATETAAPEAAAAPTGVSVRDRVAALESRVSEASSEVRMSGVPGVIDGVELRTTEHYLSRKIQREIPSQDIIETLRNPKILKDVVVDHLGRPSQRYIGLNAEVVINPETGKILSVNPVRANTRKKLTGPLK
jgi:hypothetical protein